jgi:aminoglycoside phosphotransferase (APT) family kinase protein
VAGEDEEVPGIRAEAVGRFFAERVPGAAPPLRFERIAGGRSNLTYLVRASEGERKPAEPTRREPEANEGERKRAEPARREPEANEGERKRAEPARREPEANEGERKRAEPARSEPKANEGERWVLRRPPLGHVLPTAHDMVREFTVLSALAATEVPAPRPLALCEDPEVTGAPFYVMTYAPGVVLHEELPAGFAESEPERRRISLALVDTLVRLHAVDYEAVGLGGFGRPEGFLARQLRRWSQQWERSRTRALPAVDEVLRRLASAIPGSPAPTIVHGDYRLGNLALDPRDPGRVVAIFDWEMATLGDPLTDLAYTLIFWGQVGDPPPRPGLARRQALTAKPGFLSRDELVAEYARRSGRDVSALGFYSALAHVKLAVISEGIHARHLQGKTVGEGFEFAGPQAEELAERALRFARKL